MTTYVCTYFNYYQDSVRMKLCQEFCDRYPWVILLQASYTDKFDILSKNDVKFKVNKAGFINFSLINAFLKIYTINNLVVIDADLILVSNFRLLMESSLNSYDFVHGFSEARNVMENGSMGNIVNSFYKNNEGHCGFIYGYSNRFLRKINYTFMEDFLNGGFDYVLACILSKKSLKPFEKFLFFDKILLFRDLIKNCSYTNLSCQVIHCYHGLPYKRLCDYSLYEREINLKWFEKRSKCD